MSRNRWARIARAVKTRFNIPYTAALDSCRDVFDDPEFDARMTPLKEKGLSYMDAMLQMIDEDFEFYDDEEGSKPTSPR